MLMEMMFALQVAAEPGSTRHCTGARRNEVCTEQGRAELLAELNVHPLEQEVSDGVEVYRAFYLEGGGNLPAIAIVRRPGASPRIEISGADGQTMAADVSQQVWDQVRADAAIADRMLVPLDPSPPSRSGVTIVDDVCMDGGAVMAEVGIPAPHARMSSEVRRRAASNCAHSPTLQFSRRLETIAVSVLPACAGLANRYASGIARLYFCFRLSGDQLAAAEVMNVGWDMPSVFESDGIERRRLEWRRATGVDPWTRLSWAGEDVPPNPGGREVGGATDFLIERSAELQALTFYPVKFRGVTSSMVEVEGSASYTVNDQSMYADYRQTWTRSLGGDWRVARWSVEAFEPLR